MYTPTLVFSLPVEGFGRNSMGFYERDRFNLPALAFRIPGTDYGKDRAEYPGAVLPNT
jgi:hypothetical protein